MILQEHQAELLRAAEASLLNLTPGGTNQPAAAPGKAGPGTRRTATGGGADASGSKDYAKWLRRDLVPPQGESENLEVLRRDRRKHQWSLCSPLRALPLEIHADAIASGIEASLRPLDGATVLSLLVTFFSARVRSLRMALHHDLNVISGMPPLHSEWADQAADDHVRMLAYQLHDAEERLKRLLAGTPHVNSRWLSCTYPGLVHMGLSQEDPGDLTARSMASRGGKSANVKSPRMSVTTGVAPPEDKTGEEVARLLRAGVRPDDVSIMLSWQTYTRVISRPLRWFVKRVAWLAHFNVHVLLARAQQPLLHVLRAAADHNKERRRFMAYTPGGGATSPTARRAAEGPQGRVAEGGSHKGADGRKSPTDASSTAGDPTLSTTAQVNQALSLMDSLPVHVTDVSTLDAKILELCAYFNMAEGVPMVTEGSAVAFAVLNLFKAEFARQNAQCRYYGYMSGGEYVHRRDGTYEKVPFAQLPANALYLQTARWKGIAATGSVLAPGTQAFDLDINPTHGAMLRKVDDAVDEMLRLANEALEEEDPEEVLARIKRQAAGYASLTASEAVDLRKVRVSFKRTARLAVAVSKMKALDFDTPGGADDHHDFVMGTDGQEEDQGDGKEDGQGEGGKEGGESKESTRLPSRKLESFFLMRHIRSRMLKARLRHALNFMVSVRRRIDMDRCNRFHAESRSSSSGGQAKEEGKRRGGGKGKWEKMSGDKSAGGSRATSRRNSVSSVSGRARALAALAGVSEASEDEGEYDIDDDDDDDDLNDGRSASGVGAKFGGRRRRDKAGGGTRGADELSLIAEVMEAEDTYEASEALGGGLMVRDGNGLLVMYSATLDEMACREEEMLRAGTLALQATRAAAEGAAVAAEELPVRGEWLKGVGMNSIKKVDRGALLNDLLELELTFVRRQQDLLLLLLHAYNAASSALHKEKLAAEIEHVLARRPRLDRLAHHFGPSYMNDILVLELEAELVEAVLTAQHDREMAALRDAHGVDAAGQGLSRDELDELARLKLRDDADGPLAKLKVPPVLLVPPHRAGREGDGKSDVSDDDDDGADEEGYGGETRRRFVGEYAASDDWLARQLNRAGSQGFLWELLSTLRRVLDELCDTHSIDNPGRQASVHRCLLQAALREWKEHGADEAQWEVSGMAVKLRQGLAPPPSESEPSFLQPSLIMDNGVTLASFLEGHATALARPPPPGTPEDDSKLGDTARGPKLLGQASRPSTLEPAGGLRAAVSGPVMGMGVGADASNAKPVVIDPDVLALRVLLQGHVAAQHRSLLADATFSSQLLAAMYIAQGRALGVAVQSVEMEPLTFDGKAAAAIKPDSEEVLPPKDPPPSLSLRTTSCRLAAAEFDADISDKVGGFHSPAQVAHLLTAEGRTHLAQAAAAQMVHASLLGTALCYNKILLSHILHQVTRRICAAQERGAGGQDRDAAAANGEGTGGVGLELAALIGGEVARSQGARTLMARVEQARLIETRAVRKYFCSVVEVKRRQQSRVMDRFTKATLETIQRKTPKGDATATAATGSSNSHGERVSTSSGSSASTPSQAVAPASTTGAPVAGGRESIAALKASLFELYLLGVMAGVRPYGLKWQLSGIALRLGRLAVGLGGGSANLPNPFFRAWGSAAAGNVNTTLFDDMVAEFIVGDDLELGGPRPGHGGGGEGGECADCP
eukprot:jgi/Mesvir1/5038/Mv02242-RA.1